MRIVCAAMIIAGLLCGAAAGAEPAFQTKALAFAKDCQRDAGYFQAAIGRGTWVLEPHPDLKKRLDLCTEVLGERWGNDPSPEAKALREEGAAKARQAP